MTSESIDRAAPLNLLADLESRQDELLRLLDDLEQRTKAALARLSVFDPDPASRKESPPKKVA